MIIDAPAVDWLTFTTYENDHYLGWKDWQRKLTGEQKTGKIRMYDGEWIGSSFVGEGRQGSRPHGLIRVSGTESNQAFIDLLEVGYDKCTRLDIQFTTPYLLDIRLVNLLMILDLASKVNIKDLLSYTKTATVLIRSM